MAKDIEKKEKIKNLNKKNKKLNLEDQSKLVRFYPTCKMGLTNEQVEIRMKAGLTNVVDNKNTKTYKSIFFSNIFTFFNLLCFIVAGALIAVKAYSNILFMVIILANIAIGIIQEIKAKITIEKIKLVTSPTIKVIRDGFDNEISVSQLVLDDIVVFETGKQISADSIIQEGEVEVNESLLTGESLAIKKKKGDVLYSGSFIVSGKCMAKVDKVGNESYSAKLAEKAKQYKKPNSELLRSLKLIIKCIGIIIIPLGILTYFNNINSIGGDTVLSIKNAAGSIIGMIPAGMFLLTSVALAVGVVKLAKKRTLVQDLYSIEMLARADVLCLDKTGTITDGSMKVTELINLNMKSKVNVSAVIGSMLTALDDNNQTSRALINYFGYSKQFTAKEILPFSSTRKLSAVTFKNNETYAIGAPEFVMKSKNAEIDKQIKSYASKGFRVLMLAKFSQGIVNDKLQGTSCEPIALVVIEDHIREDAAATISWFIENGVDIKIISGDNPLTVSEVCKRASVPGAEKYINLEGLSEQQIIEAVDKYVVFGRVTPEQKRWIVKALKNKGHKVAMTGDGVNDILALKEADCSIAMASGSEATRYVSHLVLLDSNFSSMPSVVAEGRRVVNNVQNSSSLFLMKTIFTMLLTIFCLILQIAYPFTTLKVIMLEFGIIGIPSFFLALQPNSSQINGKFLSNLLAKSLPAALILFLNVVACYLLFNGGIVTELEYKTMASISITFAGLIILCKLCRPINIYRGILISCITLLIAGMLIFIPYDFFEYISLSTQNVLFIIVFVQASYPLYSVFYDFFEKYMR